MMWVYLFLKQSPCR